MIAKLYLVLHTDFLKLMKYKNNILLSHIKELWKSKLKLSKYSTLVYYENWNEDFLHN